MFFFVSLLWNIICPADFRIWFDFNFIICSARFLSSKIYCRLLCNLSSPNHEWEIKWRLFFVEKSCELRKSAYIWKSKKLIWYNWASVFRVCFSVRKKKHIFFFGNNRSIYGWKMPSNFPIFLQWHAEDHSPRTNSRLPICGRKAGKHTHFPTTTIQWICPCCCGVAELRIKHNKSMRRSLKIKTNNNNIFVVSEWAQHDQTMRNS